VAVGFFCLRGILAAAKSAMKSLIIIELELPVNALHHTGPVLHLHWSLVQIQKKAVVLHGVRLSSFSHLHGGIHAVVDQVLTQEQGRSPAQRHHNLWADRATGHLVVFASTKDAVIPGKNCDSGVVLKRNNQRCRWYVGGLQPRLPRIRASGLDVAAPGGAEVWNVSCCGKEDAGGHRQPLSQHRTELTDSPQRPDFVEYLRPG